jgi:hypothetical protein
MNSARVSRAGAGQETMPIGDRDGGDGRAEHRDQHQQQHEIRQGLEGLGDAHQHVSTQPP